MPTGTVAFTDNGQAIGSIDLANATTFTTTALSRPGDHNIVATYSGGTSTLAATTSVQQAVSAAAAAVTPDATPVPTLNEWTLMLLSEVLAMFGWVRMRKR